MHPTTGLAGGQSAAQPAVRQPVAPAPAQAARPPGGADRAGVPHPRSRPGPAMDAARFAELAGRIHAEVSTVIAGKSEGIALAVLTAVSGGHLLIEDVPGVGKTMLAKALGRSLDLRTARIQFTADLLPTDVTGASVFDLGSREFQFRPGPVFANIVLADEINRSSPKTQAALLECMEENQVTVDGRSYRLAAPFMVIATQNPVDMAGTYPLPEPQRDRFLIRMSLGYPTPQAEADMAARHSGEPPLGLVRAQASGADLVAMRDFAQSTAVAAPVRDYAVALVGATRQCPLIRLGASPRATLHLLRAARSRAAMAGRSFVLPDDVREMTGPVLAHRLILSHEAVAAGHTDSSALRQAIRAVAAPAGPARA